MKRGRINIQNSSLYRISAVIVCAGCDRSEVLATALDLDADKCVEQAYARGWVRISGDWYCPLHGVQHHDY